MKKLGFFALVIGVLWVVVALNIDVSVDTGYGRVNNIGLMASRQNHIIIGGLIVLVGVLMLIFGKGSSSAAGLVKCPFCAELIQSEAIKCKHCGSMVAETIASKRAAEFKATDMSFDEFFVRDNSSGFSVNGGAVKTLAEKLKLAHPGMDPAEVWNHTWTDIESVKNQLPSGVREPFMTELKKYF